MPFGTYDYEISAEGYITVTGSYTLNASSTVGIEETLDPAIGSISCMIKASDLIAPMDALGNATVTLTNTADAEVVFSGVTGSTMMDAGYVDFTDVPFGTYDYEISAEGYITVTGSYTLNASSSVGIEETLDPAIGSISCMIKASDLIAPMDALGNATVTLTNTADAEVVFSGVTGSTMMDAGYVDFTDVPFGTYDYEISAEGYITVTGSYTLNASSTVGIEETLDPAIGSISCMIKASDLIAPMDALGNATVTLTNTADAEVVFSGVTGSTMMDAGYVDFTDVPFGTYDYEISAEGYITVTGSYTLNASSTVGIEETLDPAIGSISCMIKASDLIAPMDALGNATVTLTNTADAEVVFSGVTGSTMMDAGYVDFTDVPFGTYDYEISAEGYITVTGSYTLNASSTVGIEETLDPLPTAINNTEAAVVSIYPNPATDVINIASEKEVVSVEVIAVNGAKVKQVTRGNITQINISDLAKGIYIVVTTDVNGAKAWTKVNKL